MLWKLCNWLAKRGWFHSNHYGTNITYRGPKGKVRYSDGGISVAMPLGNAHGYARMFGGEVVPPNAEVRGDAPLYGAASLSTDGLCLGDKGD